MPIAASSGRRAASSGWRHCLSYEWDTYCARGSRGNGSSMAAGRRRPCSSKPRSKRRNAKRRSAGTYSNMQRDGYEMLRGLWNDSATERASPANARTSHQRHSLSEILLINELLTDRDGLNRSATTEGCVQRAPHDSAVKSWQARSVPTGHGIVVIHLNRQSAEGGEPGGTQESSR